MRVGILTFFQSTNYGANLQAYALQQAINKLVDKCEIINYTCEPILRINNPFKSCNKTIQGYITALIKYVPQTIRNRKFGSFRKKHMEISSEEYTRKNLEELDKVYDCFFVGSDQVWNDALTNNDLTFFLDFCSSDTKKNSYAASMGNDTPTGIKRSNIEQYLSQFSGLSTREEKTAISIEKILHRKVDWVVDPVFLINRECWCKLIGKRKIKKEYIFVFRLHGENVYEVAKKLSEQTKKPVVSAEVYMKGINGTKKDFCAGVEDFLNYIYYADHVVTDSFHCIALSLIFEKDILSILQGGGDSLNGRIVSLMRLVSQEECIIKGENIDQRNVVNYKIVNPLLEKATIRSVNYLNDTICRRNKCLEYQYLRSSEK